MVNYGRSELCPGGGFYLTDAPVKFSDKDEPVVTVENGTAPVNAFTIQDFPQYKPMWELSGRGLDMMRAVLAVFIVCVGIAKHSQHDSPFGENGLASTNKTFLLSLASLQKTVP
ncbi:hypothetical protein SPFM15_00192 [Salmonella phage SPFM15]|nr:hypothetical protein SPFM5_00187 [Salmonella phage SPFM5]VFR13816.1 hypothetical protein SPFM15_00192 [Salmonella phage SPFM15]